MPLNVMWHMHLNSLTAPSLHEEKGFCKFSTAFHSFFLPFLKEQKLLPVSLWWTQLHLKGVYVF